MPENTGRSENIILGNCREFVCRFCRTKYGWAHQLWCDYSGLTDPGCVDCAYYGKARKSCDHPVKKLKRRDAT